MIRYLLFLCFFHTAHASLLPEWSYSKASSALDKGDYAHAQELMRDLLVDDPERADLLYDLGISSFKNKEYAQAHAYFKSSSEIEGGNQRLKEQAFYNLGNASVQLNQLSDAIVHYERVLELNDQNEYAKHNLEVVKKMLEEQHPFDKLRAGDQQQQDQEKNDQAGDQQNPFDKLRAGDQQQNDKEQNQGGDQKKDQKDSSKGDDGKHNESNSGGRQQENKQGDGKDQNNQNKNPFDTLPSTELGTGRAGGEGKNGADKKEADSKNPDKESGKGQSKKDHQKNEPQKKDQNHPFDKLPSTELGTGRAGRADQNLAPEDKWILQVLDRQENAEKKTNKELIRATIDKKLAGQDGKNCW